MIQVPGHSTSLGATRLRPLWLCYLCSIGWGLLCAHACVASEYMSSATGTALAVVLEHVGVHGLLVAISLSAVRCCRSRVGAAWIVGALLAAAVAHCALWFSPSEGALVLAAMGIAPAAFVLSWCGLGLLGGLAAERRWSRGQARADRAPVLGAIVGGAIGLLLMYATYAGLLAESSVLGLSSVVVVDAGACYATIWVGSLAKEGSSLQAEAR